MYYKVQDATSCIANVDDYCQSTRLLAATTLRNVLGTKTLGEILSDRENIAADMMETLDVATEPWGVKVQRVEVKDVRLPKNLQRAMAAEAEAAREAEAKVKIFKFIENILDSHLCRSSLPRENTKPVSHYEMLLIYLVITIRQCRYRNKPQPDGLELLCLISLN